MGLAGDPAVTMMGSAEVTAAGGSRCWIDSGGSSDKSDISLDLHKVTVIGAAVLDRSTARPPESLDLRTVRLLRLISTVLVQLLVAFSIAGGRVDAPVQT
jgi:hypothetical protein